MDDTAARREGSKDFLLGSQVLWLTLEIQGLDESLRGKQFAFPKLWNSLGSPPGTSDLDAQRPQGHLGWV